MHSLDLTSCKTEQTLQQNLSAETNRVNDICIKEPKNSKQCTSVGTAHRASAGAISPCQHRALLTVLLAHRILGSQAERSYGCWYQVQKRVQLTANVYSLVAQIFCLVSTKAVG